MLPAAVIQRLASAHQSRYRSPKCWYIWSETVVLFTAKHWYTSSETMVLLVRNTHSDLPDRAEQLSLNRMVLFFSNDSPMNRIKVKMDCSSKDPFAVVPLREVRSANRDR